MPRIDKQLENTKALIGALVHMEPKPHDEMKLGRKKQPKKAKPSLVKKS